MFWSLFFATPIRSIFPFYYTDPDPSRSGQIIRIRPDPDRIRPNLGPQHWVYTYIHLRLFYPLINTVIFMKRNEEININYLRKKLIFLRK